MHTALPHVGGLLGLDSRRFSSTHGELHVKPLALLPDSFLVFSILLPVFSALFPVSHPLSLSRFPFGESPPFLSPDIKPAACFSRSNEKDSAFPLLLFLWDFKVVQDPEQTSRLYGTSGLYDGHHLFPDCFLRGSGEGIRVVSAISFLNGHQGSADDK